MAGGGGATLAGVLPAILSLSSWPGFGWNGCAEAVGDVLGIPLMAWKSALFFSGLAARVVAGFTAAFLTPPAGVILFAGRVEPLEPGGAEIRLLRAFGFGCVSGCVCGMNANVVGRRVIESDKMGCLVTELAPVDQCKPIFQRLI